jgi:hypothetical protein
LGELATPTPDGEDHEAGVREEVEGERREGQTGCLPVGQRAREDTKEFLVPRLPELKA